MHGLPYSPVSREEGLSFLASIANCSISEMDEMNPIHFVRLFLNDTRDDPIELIIKLCHLLGPYTYKGLAVLYSQNYRLSSIPEAGEPSTPTNDSEEQKDVSDSNIVLTSEPVTLSEEQQDVSDSIVLSTSEPVTLSEEQQDVSDSDVVSTSTRETMPEVVDTSERTITVVSDSNLETEIQRPQDPFVVPKSKSGCLSFFGC